MCCLCNACVMCMRFCAFVYALVCYCVCAPFARDCVCVRMLCVWCMEILMSVCNGRVLWVCVTCEFIMNVSESAMRESGAWRWCVSVMRDRDAIVCLCEFVCAHVSADSCVVLEGVVIVVRVRVASSRCFWDVWMWLMMHGALRGACVCRERFCTSRIRVLLCRYSCVLPLCVYITTCVSVCVTAY
jgi:hypothetical protein